MKTQVIYGICDKCHKATPLTHWEIAHIHEATCEVYCQVCAEGIRAEFKKTWEKIEQMREELGKEIHEMYMRALSNKNKKAS